MNPSVIFQKIDAYYDELATTSKDQELHAGDLSYVMAVMARWEQIRDEVAHQIFTLKRKYHGKQFTYDDAYRKALSGDAPRLGAATAFEERKARAETEVFMLLNEARAYEVVIEYLRDLHWHVDKKIRWLTGLQIEAREQDKRSFYQSNKDMFSVD